MAAKCPVIAQTRMPQVAYISTERSYCTENTLCPLRRSVCQRCLGKQKASFSLCAIKKNARKMWEE